MCRPAKLQTGRTSHSDPCLLLVVSSNEPCFLLQQLDVAYLGNRWHQDTLWQEGSDIGKVTGSWCSLVELFSELCHFHLIFLLLFICFYCFISTSLDKCFKQHPKTHVNEFVFSKLASILCFSREIEGCSVRVLF